MFCFFECHNCSTVWIITENICLQNIFRNLNIFHATLRSTGGNLLVLISFRIDAKLQTISNYFLLSLAVADFVIGVVSMPLYSVYLLLDWWPLGQWVCDTWLSIDYTMSNASVANLLVISIDR